MQNALFLSGVSPSYSKLIWVLMFTSITSTDLASIIEVVIQLNYLKLQFVINAFAWSSVI